MRLDIKIKCFWIRKMNFITIEQIGRADIENRLWFYKALLLNSFINVLIKNSENTEIQDTALFLLHFWQFLCEWRINLSSLNKFSQNNILNIVTRPKVIPIFFAY